MFRVLGTFVNPSLEQLALLDGNFAIRFWRRHLLLGIRRVDARDELALGGFARRNHSRLESSFREIQPQVRLTFPSILTVAVKTVLRQNRPDIAIEIDRFVSQHASAKNDACHADDREACGKI